MGSPVIIGSIVLSSFEVPADLPFATKKTLVRHEFSGGDVSLNMLGAFPQPITWSGYLTGTDALSRMQQLQRLSAIPLVVQLSWAALAWEGQVEDFNGKPKSEWMVPYTMTFNPSKDLTGVGSMASLGESLEQMLTGQTEEVDGLEDGVDGLTFPPSLVPSTNAMLSAVTVGMLAGRGTVASIPTANAAAIAADVTAVQAAAALLLNNPDATLASPALDLAARAAAVGNIVANADAGTRLLRLINPNLFMLAQKYLGDATRWGEIAAASGLTDPQPIGQYTILVPL